MGFRTGSYARVWAVDPKSDSNTVVRLSVSRKNKQTGEYEQEFSGFVSFIGTVTASKASKLREGDKIKLGDIDVTTSYVKEKQREYINYKCFSFENESGSSETTSNEEPQPVVDDGEVDDSELPF